MKKKFVLILALIIIICIFTLCLSSCSSTKGKVKYKEAIVYITGFTKKYALRSYTIDNNGIMSIDAYEFINDYQTSVEWGEELQIITHMSNVKIFSAEKVGNY